MSGRTTRLYAAGLSATAFLLLGFPPGEVLGQRRANTSVVEHTAAPERAIEGGSGMTEYAPTERERSFFDRLKAKERVTGTFFDGYSITRKKGTFVAWFGIVRRVDEDPDAATTTLLIENKYFDGSTETRLMTVSFNGAGDFSATLRGTSLSIVELSLVRVYGILTDGTDSALRVQAEYVRVWDWGSFVFREAYGEQKGNRSWKRFNAVGDHRLYHPSPTNRYYEDRLGRRSLQSIEGGVVNPQP
jgi:hypothetical protein